MYCLLINVPIVLLVLQFLLVAALLSMQMKSLHLSTTSEVLPLLTGLSTTDGMDLKVNGVKVFHWALLTEFSSESLFMHTLFQFSHSKWVNTRNDIQRT